MLPVVMLVFFLVVFVVLLVVLVVMFVGLVDVAGSVVMVRTVAVIISGRRYVMMHYMAGGGDVFHEVAALLSEGEHYSGKGGCDAYVGAGGCCGQ